MEDNEKIHAHILSVWREAKGFFTIGGKEGMLFLTDSHLMFISKTERTKYWWEPAVKRQNIAFLRAGSMLVTQDGYNEGDLRIDLENKKNLEITYDNVLEISSEKKEWANVMHMKFLHDGEEKDYQFSVVLDWVKYPIKDPMKYLKVDWEPFIEFVKSRRRISE